ncbi:MAG TPA: hypothetical protein PK050_14410 [Hyphomonadaceae bacterium]|nr:hypothetical protein [Hyphomonadaceae bacterium]
MTADAGEQGLTTDPGIRLLTRIGDFVEPLTRFDRGHLTLESSHHANIDVIARQVFRVVFETTRSEGNGGLPAGVILTTDAADTQRKSEAQFAASRIAVPARLAAWAAEHGETPTARPAVADCFTPPPPVGHIETCQPCQGAGRLECTLCHAAGTLTCEACEGRGTNPCKTCNATGEITCAACKGMRTVIRHKERRVHDEDNNSRIEHVQETVTCSTCSGAGVTKCGKCNGRTTITCEICRGQKTISCTRCQGSGYTRCEACGGEGRRHFIASISCTIRDTFETTARTADAEAAAVFKGFNSIERVLAMAESHRASAEISNDTLRRETVAVTPVTTVTVIAGGARAQIRSFGPQQDVLDYRNIAGMLLSDDLVVLEDALKTTRLIPPRVNAALYTSLSTALASEANVAIAETAARKDQAEITARFKGVVTQDYITRAGGTLKQAVSRAYWASLAKGPIAVLAIPVLQLPIELLVRGQGQGSRLMTLIGVMLMTFFAALAAHYWVTQQLQKLLAPAGAPKIPRLIDKLNLTRNWLVAAGTAAAVLTLAVASLTGILFPMNPAVLP